MPRTYIKIKLFANALRLLNPTAQAGCAQQEGQVVLNGGIGALWQFACEFAVAGQDDQPMEIQGNAIFGKGLGNGPGSGLHL